MQKWPVTPVSYLTKWILKNKKRFKNTRMLDNGCGQAQLALNFMKKTNKDETQKDPNKISNTEKNSENNKFNLFKEIVSVDLVPAKNFVIPGNMKDLPFSDSHFDSVVFSLSLMNTNYAGFLQEAIRVLKEKGFLIISKTVFSTNFRNLLKLLN